MKNKYLLVSVCNAEITAKFYTDLSKAQANMMVEFDSAVKTGCARYIGSTEMSAWCADQDELTSWCIIDLKDYGIFDFNGTGMMEVLRDDELEAFESDEDAVVQAQMDGLKSFLPALMRSESI